MEGGLSLALGSFKKSPLSMVQSERGGAPLDPPLLFSQPHKLLLPEEFMPKGQKGPGEVAACHKYFKNTVGQEEKAKGEALV